MGGVLHGAAIGTYVVPAVWTVVASATGLTSNDAGAFSGLTLRQTIQSANISASGGTQVRVTFLTNNNGTLDKAYIGNHPGSGDAYDMDSPVQLLFGGSASASLVGNTPKTSDGVNFTRIAGRALVITYYFGGSGYNYKKDTGGSTGWNSYFKNGDDASTANASGYTDYTAAQGNLNALGISQVELLI